MQKHAIMAKISCINEKKSIFEWCNGNDQMNAEYNNICGMPNGFAKWCVGGSKARCRGHSYQFQLKSYESTGMKTEVKRF